MTEVAQTLTLIRDRVDTHLIVDADTGYGNALNVVRTVRALERAGATAIQLEDQDFPEALRPPRRQGRGARAGDVRKDPRSGRCPAVTRNAHHRAHRRHCGRGLRAAPSSAPRLYRDAGADLLFVEAPRTRDDLARIVKTLESDVPLMANMVEGGKTPTLLAAELEALGFAIVIFPGAIVRALGYMASELLRVAGGARLERALSQPHARFRRHQRAHRHARDDGARPTL